MRHNGRISRQKKRARATLSEKEAIAEEANRLVADNQQHISSLEQGLAKSQVDLSEIQKKMSNGLQVEATLKSEAEKQKKLATHLKVKRVEILNKEKEELSREKQILSKQLEDAISSRKRAGENANEQSLKEKKEKDTRIQMLERTLEREREDLRKEKEDHRKEKSKQQKIEMTIRDLMQTAHQNGQRLTLKVFSARVVHVLSLNFIGQSGHNMSLKSLVSDAQKLSVEISKPEVLELEHAEKKKLMEELEAHKHARDSLLETTGIIEAQLPSETSLRHQTAAYILAVDNFDAELTSVLNGLTAQPVPSDTSLSANVSPAATESVMEESFFESTGLWDFSGQQAPEEALISMVPSITSGENSSQGRMTKEREKRTNMQKSIETRKVGRKLVRPPLQKMQEPKVSTEASGKEAFSVSDVKPDASNVIPHSELPSTSFQPVRKRLASSPAFEFQGELLSQQMLISDVAPLLKKSKGSDKPQDTIKEKADHLASENLEKPVRDWDDSPGHDLIHAIHDSVDIPKDQEVDNAKEPPDEPKQPSDSMNDKGLGSEDIASMEEFMEKPQEIASVSDVLSDIGLPEQQSLTEMENETEDGELIPDGTSQEGSDPSGIIMDLEPGEYLSESAVAASDLTDTVEIGSSGDPIQEQNDTSEVTLEAAEGSDKHKPVNYDHSVSDSQQSPQPSVGAGEGSPNLGGSIVLTHGSLSFTAEPEEGRESQAGKSTTTIVISERARAKAALRQAGLLSPIDTDRGRASGIVKLLE
ncbi:hypothetical protein ACLOJK_029827 [Asimina triloba]